MATNPKSPAEAQALKARRDADGKKAMAEYEADGIAMPLTKGYCDDPKTG